MIFFATDNHHSYTHIESKLFARDTACQSMLGIKCLKDFERTLSHGLPPFFKHRYTIRVRCAHFGNYESSAQHYKCAGHNA